jgi:autotransporter-associated beta strand protein
MLTKICLLSAVSAIALFAEPARTATIVVNNQAQFDAAIAVATQPGHTDTIDATGAGTIDAGTSLTLPANATSVNVEFGQLAIGASGTGNETVTLGAGSTLTFEQVNAGTLNMGSGNTGTLNINGASLIFNVTTQGEQFNIGLDGGNGIVNMTSGAVTINDSAATPGVIGSISIGYPFGVTAANATFNQSGGTVSVSAGALNVGVANGNGIYNLTGTAVLQERGATAYIGASTGGVGNVNISGNATIDFESITAGAAGQLFVGDNLGVGTITQNSANSTVILNVSNISQFGSNASNAAGGGGTGTYNLVAGTLNIGGGGAAFGMDVGGVGFLNQSGGTLTASALIVIGESGTGTYAMSGGAANLGAGLTAGLLAGSTGTVNQTGGIVAVSGGRVAIGAAGTGAYNLNGGLLQVGGTNGITGTGSLNLGGGTLQVIGSALTTANIMALTGTGSVIDTNGLGATFNGVMSGTGGFTKAGAGTLVLTATDTYSGGTVISGGTLQIGSGGTTGSIVGNVTDNSALVFNRSNASAFAGAISGAGTLAKMGAGVLTLSGPGTYTGATSVNAGTLQAGAANVFSQASAYTISSGAVLNLANFSNSIGSLAGSGNVTLGSAALTTGNDGTSTTFSGAIGGTGGLTKVGGGALTLSGASTYTGATNINAGVLNVTGSIASQTLTVNSGGTLSGSGTIGDPLINAGGTLAPGDPNAGPGTLTIVGPLTFQPGSYYDVRVAPGANDRTNVAGVTVISGGIVIVSPFGGTYQPNTTYTLLNATLGVNGRFAGVTDGGLPFLTLALSYDANDVFLGIMANYGFAIAARTRNELAVANALAAAGPKNPNAPVIVAFDNLTVAQATASFDTISGEGIAAADTAGLQANQLFTSAMSDQTTLWLDGGNSGGQGRGNEMVLNEPAPGALFYASAANMKSPIVVHDALLPATRTWRAWASGFGGDENVHGDSSLGTTAQSAAFYGGAMGIDYQIGPTLLFGVAGGGSDGSFNVPGRATYGSVTGGHIGTYGVATFGSFYGASSTSLSFFHNSETRMIAGFGGLGGEKDQGGYDSHAVRTRFEFGRRFANVYGATLTPFVALEIADLRSDGFTETPLMGAGNFALNVQGRDTASVPAYVGLRFERLFDLSGGMSLKPSLSLAYGHDFAPQREINNALVGLASNPFEIDGAQVARNFAQTKAGFELAFAPNAVAFVNFDGEFSNKDQLYGGKGGIKLAW